MLSIIAAHGYRQDDVRRFLASVRANVPGDGEIVLATGVPLPTGLVAAYRAARPPGPSLRVITVPGAGISQLRGAGLTAATGDVLAFVDPSCRLTAGWLETLLREIADTPALTGPVAYGGGRSLVTWAAFLSEYGAFLPPAGTEAGVAGANFIIRRTVLATVQPAGAAFDKPAVVEAFRQAGITPRFHPGLTVVHRRPWRLVPFLWDRFTLGSAYAQARSSGLPASARLLRALAAPLVGPLLFARLAATMARKPRGRTAFVRAAPVTLAFLTAWALGEGAGYLTTINMTQKTE